MKQIKKILSKIIIIFLINMQIIFSTVSFAESYDPEVHGAAMAEFAEQFVEEHASETKYQRDGGMAEAAEGQKSSDGYYHFCCTVFVDFVYRSCIGINLQKEFGNSWGAADWFDKIKSGKYVLKEISRDELMPGDVLELKRFSSSATGHAMLYLGEGEGGKAKVAHSTTVVAEGCSPGVEVAERSLDGYIFGRVKDDVDVELLVDFVGGKKKDYKYYGLPSEGEYTGTETLWEKLKSALKWVINLLSQIADYLVGIMTMFIRMQMVGWTAIIEELVTKSINAVTGEVVVQEDKEDDKNNSSANNTNTMNNQTTNENTTGNQTTNENTTGNQTTNENTTGNQTANENTTDSQTENKDDPEIEALMRPASNDKKIIDDDRITVERIIYNQIPILDIDIFNPTEAAGKTLKEDGALAIIRKTIATWYNVIRNVSIVAMLIVLLYLGIKLAISSVAKDKAKYKSMLVNWLVGFIIIVGIHYIMITIIWLNQQLVDIFVNLTPDNELSLYETVRTKAYELKFSSGFIGAIMYMYLVYLMLRYLYVYIRRMFTIVILIVMAPVMGVAYAVNKIKNGKNISFKNWFTDFAAFTFIQSVHALIYTTFLNIVLELSTESLPGIIISFIVLNFMLKADKIIVDMFGLSHSSELSSAIKPGGYARAFLAVKTVGAATRQGLGFAKGTAKTTMGVVGFIGGAIVPEQIKSKFKLINYNFNKKYNTMLDNVFGEDNIKKHRPTSDNMGEAEIKLEQIRAEKRKLKRENRRTSIDFGTKMIKGGFQALAAVPLTIADPKSGLTLASRAYDNLNAYKRIKKYKSYKDKNVRYYAKKIALVPVTLSGVAFIPTRYMVKRADVKQKETLIKEELNPKMQVLFTAKMYEDRLEKIYNEIMIETNQMCDSQENQMFGLALKEKYNESLQEGINNALKGVTDEQVKLAIMDYTTLKTKDIDYIIEELQLTVQDKFKLRNDTRKEIEMQSKEMDKDALRKLLEEKEMYNVSEKQLEEIIERINNDNNVKEMKKESIASEIKKELGKENKVLENNVIDKIADELVEKGVKEKDEITELATSTLKRIMIEQNIELSEKDTNEVIKIVEKVSESKRLGRNNIDEELQSILNQLTSNSNMDSSKASEIVSSMKEEQIKNRNEVMSKENLENIINNMARNNNINIDSKKVEKMLEMKQKDKNTLTTSDVNNIVNNVQRIINDEKADIQLTEKAKENTKNEIMKDISKSAQKELKDTRISKLIPDSTREELINEIQNLPLGVSNEKDIRKIVKGRLKNLEAEKIDLITKNIKAELDLIEKESRNTESIAKSITKGLNKRDSIDRGRNVQMHEEFIDNIYKLKDINEISEERFGKPTYKDIRVTLKRIEDLYKN